MERVTNGGPLPATDRGTLHVVAKAIHWSLYALLLAMVGVGLFNLFSIPAFDPGNRDLVHQTQGIHATIDWIIVGLHTTAAPVHHYVWHDGLLRRMLPARDT